MRPPSVSTSSSSDERRGSTALGELLELDPRIGFPQPVVEHGQHSGFGFVMLVLDLADDLLDDVLDGDQALGAAELVDDDSEVDALGAHPGEQLDDAHRFGDEQGVRASAPSIERSRLGSTLATNTSLMWTMPITSSRLSP